MYCSVSFKDRWEGKKRIIALKEDIVKNITMNIKCKNSVYTYADKYSQKKCN